MIEPQAHLQRIAAYCAAISTSLGADPKLLGPAAWLHDVGMVAINIGARPGRLTERERRELTTHPEIGYALLAGSGVPVLDLGATVALTHHEDFDGGGYPRGLVGEEIPLAGRIVAVADAFDALVTDRAHRPAGSIADAEMVLHAGRGQQFDPWIVATFLAARDDVLLALRRFPAAERLNPDDYVSVRTAASVLAIPRAGCAAGPTTAGSTRRARRAGTGASGSMTSGGSPPTSARSVCCGRSRRRSPRAPRAAQPRR